MTGDSCHSVPSDTERDTMYLQSKYLSYIILFTAAFTVRYPTAVSCSSQRKWVKLRPLCSAERGQEQRLLSTLAQASQSGNRRKPDRG